MAHPVPADHNAPKNIVQLLALSPLEKEIKNLIGGIYDQFQTNRWKEKIIFGDDLKVVCSRTRLEALADAFYTQAKEDKILQSEERARREQFVSFVLEGNLRTLAILLYSGCGYRGLWYFDNGGQILAATALEAGYLNNESPMRSAFQAAANAENGASLCFDDFLPLRNEAEAVKIFGSHLGSVFYDSQYIFYPVEFREFEHFIKEDPKLRLPILERVLVGSGSCGEVYQVTIAKHGLIDENGAYNSQPRDIAQKVFSSGKHDQREADRGVESEIFKRARESSTHTDGIVPWLGSLDDIEELSLFFRFAPMSLAELIQLDINKKLTLKQLLLSLARLGETLGFLHDGGHSKDGVELRVSHRDLSPRNVLIFDMDDFRITDFGLARILAADEDGNYNTTRQSPEDGSDYSAPNCVLSTSRDVWAFVAMSLVAIVWKIGAADLVNDFSRARSGNDEVDRKFWTRIGAEPAKVNHFMTEWITLTLQKRVWKIYAADHASRICDLLNTLIGFFDLLIASAHSTSKDTAREPSLAIKVTQALRAVANHSPSIDSIRSFTPESTIASSSGARSSSIDSYDPHMRHENGSLCQQAATNDLGLSAIRSPGVEMNLPLASSSPGLLGPASETVTPSQAHAASSVAAEGPESTQPHVVELTPRTSIRRSERALDMQQDRREPLDKSPIVFGQLDSDSFPRNPIPQDYFLNGLGGSVHGTPLNATGYPTFLSIDSRLDSKRVMNRHAPEIIIKSNLQSLPFTYKKRSWRDEVARFATKINAPIKRSWKKLTGTSRIQTTREPI